MAPTPWGLRSGGGRPWRDTEPTAAASESPPSSVSFPQPCLRERQSAVGERR